MGLALVREVPCDSYSWERSSSQWLLLALGTKVCNGSSLGRDVLLEVSASLALGR